MSDLQATRRSTRRALAGLAIGILAYFLILALGWLPHAPQHHEAAQELAEPGYVPPLWAVFPFASILLAIAILPLVPVTEHWWHHNRNRFTIAVVFSIITLAYYYWLHPGGIANHFSHQEHTAAGWETMWAAFCNGIFSEFIPFIILLFALYVISGGVSLSGDLRAHPATNTAFLATGTALASFIGTTGAAMVLIRPLLSTNAERRRKVHTVVFFIFTVCNCGGLLLPIGDPPLFLGYLRGVPFTWTLGLWPYWLGVNLTLLAIYFIWDSLAYRKERKVDIRLDEALVRRLRLRGIPNLFLLLLVVLCVGLVVPEKPFLGTGFRPPVFLREVLMCILVFISLAITKAEVRMANRFDYHAIGEVAALFSGIFITMQVPIEILHARGHAMGLNSPGEFFWSTGVLSSFLDNAPTYVVFFETAASMNTAGAQVLLDLGRQIDVDFLIAISLGAVFMGANTYIGNGPNFMVKSIAQTSGVRMPSFFGYMIYSIIVLVPIFVVVTFLI